MNQTILPVSQPRSHRAQRAHAAARDCDTARRGRQDGLGPSVSRLWGISLIRVYLSIRGAAILP